MYLAYKRLLDVAQALRRYNSTTFRDIVRLDLTLDSRGLLTYSKRRKEVTRPQLRKDRE